MDKVKLYLEIARKHHFWILCGISVAAGLTAWYMASGKLKAQFDQDRQTIDQTFASLKGVSTTQPRTDWTDGIKKETSSVAEDVKQAWTQWYKEQKEKVFVWPKELSNDFLAAAAHLDDPKTDLSRNLLEYYQRRVKQQVAQLPKIVDAASLDELGVQPGGGGFFNAIGLGAAAAGSAEHRVDWSTGSQQDIAESFDWTERPSTLLVKYAQEELWVYQALCHVIKAVNEGTTGRSDAHITQIAAMEIAYNAVEDSPGGAGQNHVEPLGNSTGVVAPVAPTGPGDVARSRPDPKLRGKREGSGHFNFGAAAADAAANPDDVLKNFRYVKADGTPEMKEDVDADTGSEYRLMPFRLLLRMDGRYLDRLLTEFRNSILPIEVQEVRINPEHTATGVMSFHGGGPGVGPGVGPGRGPGGGEHMSVATAAAPTEDRSITVEVRGVVYLLNPPELQRLPVAAFTDNTGGVAAAAPAAATPPAAAGAPPAGTEPAATPALTTPATPVPAPATSPGPGVPAPATTPPNPHASLKRLIR